ncbi:signal transduction histidine kinase [Desulfitispora alkaliphila]|uniref:hypothetical protein n=1 Tax=Desulfitispora alkaliphila TaxID=622674 RepID=UPI003D1F41E0
MAYMGLSLVGKKPTIKKVLLISLLYATAVHLVRGIYILQELSFGSHTLLLLIIFILILRVVALNWGKAAISGISVVSLILLGFFIPLFFINLFELAHNEILNNVWLHIAIGLSESTVLIFAIVIQRITKLTINIDKLTA